MQSSSNRKDARFWDRMAKRYSEKPVPDEQVYNEKIARTNAYLKPEHTVLDLGCGTGTTAIHHAPKVQHILATDLSDGMLDIATQKAAEAGITNISFKAASVDEAVDTDKKFDVVMAHSLLHLLQDPEDTLKGIHTLLNPGGLLVTSTPCIAEFMPIMRYILPVGRAIGLIPYIGVFSEKQFQQWFSNAGFEVAEEWKPSPKSGIYCVHRVVA